MKTKWVVGVCSLVMGGMLHAQNPAPDPTPPRPPKGARVLVRHEMGQWWKNPDIASKLQLTDAQVAQLNQVFAQGGFAGHEQNYTNAITNNYSNGTTSMRTYMTQPGS